MTRYDILLGKKPPKQVLPPHNNIIGRDHFQLLSTDYFVTLRQLEKIANIHGLIRRNNENENSLRIRILKEILTDTTILDYCGHTINLYRLTVESDLAFKKRIINKLHERFNNLMFNKEPVRTTWAGPDILSFNTHD